MFPTHLPSMRETGALRLGYLGLPLGALVLMRHGWIPRWICVGHLNAPGLARLRRLIPPDVLLLGKPDLNDAHIQDALKTSVDAALSWFWPRLIPEALLKSWPLGAYGVHPSLLPRHRGPDPYFHAILEGDARSGATLHRLDGAFDTGAIVAQQTVLILDSDNAYQLARRIDRPSLDLLVAAAAALELSRAPLFGPQQDPSVVTQAPRPSDQDLVLDLSESTARVLRRMRAALPAPGPSLQLGDEYYFVLEAAAWDGAIPSGLRPTEAFVVQAPNGARLCVRTLDGAIRLERIEHAEEGAQITGVDIAALPLAVPSLLPQLPQDSEAQLKDS